MRRLRRGVTPLVTVVAALAAVAAPAWAVGSIPNLTIGNPSAQLAAPPSVAEKLTLPFDGAPAAGTGDTGSPEDDLAQALDDLSSAPDVASATSARTLALSILEGDPIPRKAYSGIPLLNWNAPAKVKTVPAGGNVTVSEVRFGDHVLSDTWLLDFADPSAPFTITYDVAELGVGFGGVFAPTVLASDGSGQPSVLQTLALPELPAGTTTTNRFHPAGAAEHTRLGIQQFTVHMPPPHDVEAVVDPGVEPGPAVTSLVTLRPATAQRLAAAQADFGFSGPAPTDAQKIAAIGRLGANAPEKVLWSHLRALDPAAPDFLAVAHQLGSQDADLVAAMRSRYAPGVQTDPGADVAVVLENDEAYLSRRRLHLDPGRPLTVSVTNADGFAHRFQALELHDRSPAFGALDWGRFQWSQLGDEGTLAPGASETVTLTPNDTTFELWLGDPDSGDQAGLPLRLDRGPLRQSLRFTPDWAHPNHSAVDAHGHLWVTLGGVDALAEVTPDDDLSAASEREYPLPGGDATFATGGKLDPHDVAVDGNGIVWATLADGNAIARLDPAQANPGTSAGIHVYPLADCPACAPPFPPEPGVAQPPTRDPEQLAVQQDAAGNTLVWFTEFAANAIGVLRVAGDGTLLTHLDVPCDCNHPKGIALGADGSVWFSEEDSNRIGRLTLAPGPFEAAGMQIVHSGIPSAPTITRPGQPDIATSSPHSVAVDPLGRVWFSEEENASLGYLDPAAAHSGTTDGVAEVQLPDNEFGEQAAPADLTVDRAGKVFFVDEYGDAVGAATSGGLDQYWRPRARQSITDKPVVDSSGNLWFTETGANLLTRLSNLAAPALPPAAPPVLTADTIRHTIAATGLRDVAAADVAVDRDGIEVAHASAPVAGGAFSVGVPVQGGELVHLTLHGTYEQVISFPVADVRAAVADDGSVRGRLAPGDEPPGDVVQVGVAGRSADAPLARDGSFASASGFAATTDSGTVTYAGATTAGIFRSVLAFGPAPAASEPEPPAAPAPADPAPAPAASAAPRQHGAPHVGSSRRAVSVAARGRRALALVSYRWRRLGYRIVFAPAKVGVRATTDTRRHTITVYVRTTDTPQRIAHDIAHELGHAYDARFLRPRDHRAYLGLRRRPRATWWPTAPGSDYASGAGDFAEVFALCHAPSKEFRSTLAPRPKHPCALIAAVTPRKGNR